MLLELVNMSSSVSPQLLPDSPSLVSLDSISLTMCKLIQQLLHCYHCLAASKVLVGLHL